MPIWARERREDERELMLPATDAPKRPALRYYGGKWNLAPWIISHFPPHKNYVEPCGGAASVLLQKPRSPLETYNDLDGDVVNFFRVLRDQPDELIRRIRLTPWARTEYELALEPTIDNLERARRFWVFSIFSLNGSMVPGESWFATETGAGNPKGNGVRSQSAFIDELSKVAERFIGVQIENVRYQDLIAKYDNADALTYFDPPYVSLERVHRNRYVFEWPNSHHVEAATLLRNCVGYAIVSGYACPLYSELYEAHGWQRVDKEAQTNSGGKRIESLWLSPRTVEALNMPRQVALFGADLGAL